MSVMLPTTESAELAGPETIRPFQVDVPQAALDDLRRRIADARWPDRETDPSQGVRLETIQALAGYCATEYDWRGFEERFAACRSSSPRSTPLVHALSPESIFATVDVG